MPEENRQTRPPYTGVGLQPLVEDLDTIRFVTTVKPKDTDKKNDSGVMDKQIYEKFDSLLAPNTSFANYDDHMIRSQMWRASFIGDRIIDSYSDSEYDPMILPKVESAKGVVVAKLSQGKEGKNNLLKVLRSVWSHHETVQTSKHEEKLQAKTRGMKLGGR